MRRALPRDPLRRARPRQRSSPRPPSAPHPRAAPRGERAKPVSQPADPRLQGPHQVSRSDHVVPTSQYLAAEERPAPDSLVDLGDRVLVGALDSCAQFRGSGVLVGCGRSDDLHPGREAVEGPRACAGRARTGRPRRPRGRRGAAAPARAPPPGSNPSSSTVSRITSSSASPRLRSRSICLRWPLTSSTASGGTRLSTTLRAVPRSRAAVSRSQGTASA
jgi:hypothetical protein